VPIASIAEMVISEIGAQLDGAAGNSETIVPGDTTHDEARG